MLLLILAASVATNPGKEGFAAYVKQRIIRGGGFLELLFADVGAESTMANVDQVNLWVCSLYAVKPPEGTTGTPMRFIGAFGHIWRLRVLESEEGAYRDCIAAETQHPVGGFKRKLSSYRWFVAKYPRSDLRGEAEARISRLENLMKNGQKIRIKVAKAFAPGCTKKSVGLRVFVYRDKTQIFASKKIWSYGENPKWKEWISITWYEGYRMSFFIEEFKKGQKNRTIINGWVDPRRFPGRVSWQKSKAWAVVEVKVD